MWEEKMTSLLHLHCKLHPQHPAQMLKKVKIIHGSKDSQKLCSIISKILIVYFIISLYIYEICVLYFRVKKQEDSKQIQGQMCNEYFIFLGCGAIEVDLYFM